MKMPVHEADPSIFRRGLDYLWAHMQAIGIGALVVGAVGYLLRWLYKLNDAVAENGAIIDALRRSLVRKEERAVQQIMRQQVQPPIAQSIPQMAPQPVQSQPAQARAPPQQSSPQQLSPQPVEYEMVPPESPPATVQRLSALFAKNATPTMPSIPENIALVFDMYPYGEAVADIEEVDDEALELEALDADIDAELRALDAE